MSIINGDEFRTMTEMPENTRFTNLFSYDEMLLDASNLILPATKLTNYCYQYMFQDCTSLTSAPELPATTLANYCYSNMFDGCTSLTEAPKLPATKLADGCYSSMFEGCTSLTTAPPKLLALPLPIYYDTHKYMFSQCTSLTKSPIIYGVSNSQMQGMFNRCSSLNEITSFFTYYEEGILNSWVNGVSPNGTFYTFKYNKDKWERGDNGIPINWDVHELTHFIIPDPQFKQEENADSTITYTSTTGWRKLQIFSQNPSM